MKQLLFLFVLFLSIDGAAGSIYKWSDDHGVVHFSTIPPKNRGNTETIEKPKVQKISNDVSKMPESEGRSESTIKKQAIEANEKPMQKTKGKLWE